MAWDIEKSLAQQRAIEKAARLDKERKRIHAEENLSTIADYLSAVAQIQDFTSTDELRKHLEDIMHAEMNDDQIKTFIGTPGLKLEDTYVRSKTTGKRIKTTNWDARFKWFAKIRDSS